MVKKGLKSDSSLITKVLGLIRSNQSPVQELVSPSFSSSVRSARTLIHLLPPTGRQARDVQLRPRHDLRPHRVALPDPVRHAPAGRALRAQAESHLQDRLRQQVRIRPLGGF